ncbi:uncharacterized protein MYCFIDRAFT_177623 [Pseudocercospora fijiensis CIRAD86]|uniref:RING-type domain-containing protein n=1 Tax=Pseudocercospora fijiensis (strain CIRAD86) TaxID=383855 RepID=M3AU78_PSEFD|nr:uncharacterized protein MYCFIDRAFT_177623 [Pseudocercospora fijiensis CIRAD86]EME80688.1 hypothetical protein MYCFIDRAFT_177623 [Pseudocercospora fijiensis CIRAD86]
MTLGMPDTSTATPMRLVQDMALITQWAGWSYIFITTYRATNGERKIGITCDTRICMRHGAGKDMKHHYQFELEAFLLIFGQPDQRKLSPVWINDILDMLRRESDFAVVCYEMHRRATGQLQEDIPWKPRRSLERWSIMLPGVVTAARPTAGDATCPICFEDYDSLFRRPVSLPCSPIHAMCFDCVVSHCQSQGEDASCPHCRTAILADPKWFKYLRHGLNQNGDFFPDPRFTYWENWERSCADLDELMAEDDDTLITVHPQRALQVLSLLLCKARSERFASTPRGLSPADFPEMDLVEQTIRNGIIFMRRKVLRVSTISAYLMRQVTGKLLDAFLESEVHTLYSDDNLTSMILEPRDWDIFLEQRPGFYRFVERMISRTLRFMYMRSCNCGNPELHSHGWRMFYDEKAIPLRGYKPFSGRDHISTLAETDRLRTADCFELLISRITAMQLRYRLSTPNCPHRKEAPAGRELLIELFDQPKRLRYSQNRSRTGVGLAFMVRVMQLRYRLSAANCADRKEAGRDLLSELFHYALASTAFLAFASKLKQEVFPMLASSSSRTQSSEGSAILYIGDYSTKVIYRYNSGICRRLPCTLLNQGSRLQSSESSTTRYIGDNCAKVLYLLSSTAATPSLVSVLLSRVLRKQLRPLPGSNSSIEKPHDKRPLRRSARQRGKGALEAEKDAGAPPDSDDDVEPEASSDLQESVTKRIDLSEKNSSQLEMLHRNDVKIGGGVVTLTDEKLRPVKFVDHNTAVYKYGGWREISILVPIMLCNRRSALNAPTRYLLRRICLALRVVENIDEQYKLHLVHSTEIENGGEHLKFRTRLRGTGAYASGLPPLMSVDKVSFTRICVRDSCPEHLMNGPTRALKAIVSLRTWELAFVSIAFNNAMSTLLPQKNDVDSRIYGLDMLFLIAQRSRCGLLASSNQHLGIKGLGRSHSAFPGHESPQKPKCIDLYCLTFDISMNGVARDSLALQASKSRMDLLQDLLFRIKPFIQRRDLAHITRRTTHLPQPPSPIEQNSLSHPPSLRKQLRLPPNMPPKTGEPKARKPGKPRTNRPTSLFRVDWSTEMEALCFLLGVYYNLYRVDRDVLEQIVHRAFPIFKRARKVAASFYDRIDFRWSPGRQRESWHKIDRQDERSRYHGTPFTQNQLNDLATINGVVNSWAAHLNKTLTPVAGVGLDFSNGVADPAGILHDLTDSPGTKRTALVPGEQLSTALRNKLESHWGDPIHGFTLTSTLAPGQSPPNPIPTRAVAKPRKTKTATQKKRSQEEAEDESDGEGEGEGDDESYAAAPVRNRTKLQAPAKSPKELPKSRKRTRVESKDEESDHEAEDEPGPSSVSDEDDWQMCMAHYDSLIFDDNEVRFKPGSDFPDSFSYPDEDVYKFGGYIYGITLDENSPPELVDSLDADRTSAVITVCNTDVCDKCQGPVKEDGEKTTFDAKHSWDIVYRSQIAETSDGRYVFVGTQGGKVPNYTTKLPSNFVEKEVAMGRKRNGEPDEETVFKVLVCDEEDEEEEENDGVEEDFQDRFLLNDLGCLCLMKKQQGGGEHDISSRRYNEPQIDLLIPYLQQPTHPVAKLERAQSGIWSTEVMLIGIAGWLLRGFPPFQPW